VNEEALNVGDEDPFNRLLVLNYCPVKWIKKSQLTFFHRMFLFSSLQNHLLEEARGLLNGILNFSFIECGFL
jgi:hypothetical protein